MVGTAIGVAAAAVIGYKIGNAIYEALPRDEFGNNFADNLVGGAMEELSFNPFKNIKTMIRGYASGGTPETGSLFLANENGPELVANIGRKTQVANNDQIMQSISAGVEVANMQQNQLLMEQNELLRKLLAKDIEVNTFVSTDSLISGLDRKNRRDGRAVVPIGG